MQNIEICVLHAYELNAEYQNFIEFFYKIFNRFVNNILGY